ncbi:MAG: DUF5995 family protein [Myxococcales bacterium]|nr:DUF5995 family protein [Myxococcales bacterium]
MTAASRSQPMAGVTSLETLAQRLKVLDTGFDAKGDRRGLFTAVYAPCVARLVRAIRGGELKDPATAERVVLALGRSYLRGLERGGVGPTGGPGSAWDSFFARARRRDTSDAQVLASAFNAHWGLDLVSALAEARAPASFGGDLQTIGRLLVDEVQSLLDRPSTRTSRRVADVFEQQPLFLTARGLFGRGATMHVGMSTLMAEAFAISQLPAPLRRANEASWGLREALFQVL